MGVNGIETQPSYMENVQYAYSAKSNGSKIKQTASDCENTTALQDVYEKSAESPTDSAKQIYSRDSIVEQLKADAKERKEQLIHLVQQTISKQGKTYSSLSDIFNDIKNGVLSVDPSVVEQAKKDVAEDGYWGVEQTSERLVSFAKALSGGDASKAEEMIAAVEKGFKLATEAWGDELPSLCKDTLTATKEKLTTWKNELNQNV